jgi:hypothetical protein
VGDGLGEVADGLVAGVEEPGVDAGPLAGECRQQGARHDLARLAAGQEVHRPGRVARRGGREVALQRIDLGARRRRRVELGEELREPLHAAASSCSSFSPYSVSNELASSPWSESQRTITAS